MDPRSHDPHDSEHDFLAAFLPQRRRLFGIAYRILGSAFEAEDVVQETWIRWQRCDRTGVREPAAFLAKTATHLAINVRNSAHHRRETCIGRWLSLQAEASEDPTLGAERDEAVALATLHLMERLTASERAAFVLREAFAYPYSRIAEIICASEPASRQLVSRARRRLSEAAAYVADREAHRRLLRAFLDAARGGDTRALEELLAPAAMDQSDGAGAARRSARRSTRGRETRARTLRSDDPRRAAPVRTSRVAS